MPLPEKKTVSARTIYLSTFHRLNLPLEVLGQSKQKHVFIFISSSPSLPPHLLFSLTLSFLSLTLSSSPSLLFLSLSLPYLSSLFSVSPSPPPPSSLSLSLFLHQREKINFKNREVERALANKIFPHVFLEH